MAYTWEDSFIRADGPIGNGWLREVGTVNLYSNHMRIQSSGGRAIVVNPDTLTLPDYTAEATIDLGLGGINNVIGVVVRNPNDSNTGYYIILSTSANAYLEMGRLYAVANREIWATFGSLGSYMTGTHKIGLRVAGQTLYGYLDDVLMWTRNDTTLAGGLYAGVFALNLTSNAYISHFGIIANDITAISVDQLSLVASSPGNTLLLQGYGTNWTPGNPGSPIFTATAGTITAQVVDDVTHATLTYTAPALPQVVTFDDPASHAAVQVGVQVQLFLGTYATFYGLTPLDLLGITPALQWLATALTSANATLASIVLQVIDPTGRLYALWQMLTGASSPVGSMPDLILGTGPDALSLIHADTAGSLSGITEALVQLGLIRGLEYYTLPDVIAAIDAVAGAVGKPYDPVVYPGQAHITYSDVVPFSAPVVVDGPMNGAHVVILSVPSGTGKMGSGNGTMWYRIGRWAFADDVGFYEPWEYLTFQAGNLVPKTLRQAGSLMIQCTPGVTGSVHPYLVNP